MLGTRGMPARRSCNPEIYEMQVRAIMRAQRAVTERLGHPPQLEVMVPLVDYERELELMRGADRPRRQGGGRAHASTTSSAR